MKKLFTLVCLLFSLNAFSQVSHTDSIVGEQNINTFQFNQNKVCFTLGQHSFTQVAENQYTLSIEGLRINISFVNHKLDYYTAAELNKMGKGQVAKDKRKLKGYIEGNYVVKNMHKLNVLNVQYTQQTNNLYVFNNEYTFNTQNQLILIQFTTAAETKELLDKTMAEYIPVYDYLIENNLKIFENFYKIEKPSKKKKKEKRK